MQYRILDIRTAVPENWPEARHVVISRRGMHFFHTARR